MKYCEIIENNIDYIGNEGYRKAFSFSKKENPWEKKKEEGRGRNLGFASGGLG